MTVKPEQQHEALRSYLIAARGFPEDLADHMARHVVRLIDQAHQIRHWIEGLFGNRSLAALPDRALIIPYHGLDGAPLIDARSSGEYQRLRLDPAVEGSDGKAVRYLAPGGTSNHLYFPRPADGGSLIALAKTVRLLIFTEGEIKAAVATWFGFPSIAVSGVWNWKGSRGKHRKTQPDGSHELEKAKSEAIPDLELIPWAEVREAGVRVVIMFDSDASQNGKVSHARNALAKHLRDTYGVDVWIANLPGEANGDKNGLDDYLLRHGADALRQVLDGAKRTGKKERKPRTPEELAALELIDVGELTDEDLDARIIVLRDRVRAAEDGGREQKALERELSEAKLEQDCRRAESEYGLNLRGKPYIINSGGVRRAARGNADPVISTRPIWPAAVGRDVATGGTFVEVAWMDTTGAEVRAWLPHQALSDPRALCELDGANVPRGRVNHVSNWLSDATGYLVGDRKAAKVASRMGWVGKEGDRRFILPCSADVAFIGQGWEVAGSADAWAKGLRMLAELGPAGYVGLAVVGLCAAAPLVRFLGYHRNPTIGLVGTSGSGKNTLIEYGLSMWGAPAALSVSIGSTAKGIQDANVSRAGDLPFFVDELQRLYNQDHDGPRQVADLLYFLGNGQRRTTSSRTQQAVGGERRWGCNLYASEDPLTESLATGAGNRAIELTGLVPVGSDRRFVPDRTFADALKAIAGANQGALAAALAEAITRDQARIADGLTAIAGDVAREHAGLQGDDHFTIAVVVAGLVLVEDLIDLELSAVEVGRWLATFTARERAAVKDRARQAFEAVCGLALGAVFTPASGDTEAAIVGGEFIAWRSGPDVEWLDINPHHPQVEARLRSFGGGKRLAQVWRQRGWVLSQDGRHVGWNRRGVGWVWRILGTFLDGVFRIVSEAEEPKRFHSVSTVLEQSGNAEARANG
ncbi:MAG TPA: DUF927 domain-containing protein [Oscillatoriaceae cyanobacterium]